MGDWRDQAGGARPQGPRLQARARDVIVEIERFDTVDVRLLETEVPVTVRYFASLPVANPDGTRGIAMHIVYRPPTRTPILTMSSNDSTKVIPRADHIGAVHSMFCGAEGDPGFVGRRVVV